MRGSGRLTGPALGVVATGEIGTNLLSAVVTMGTTRVTSATGLPADGVTCRLLTKVGAEGGRWWFTTGVQAATASFTAAKADNSREGVLFFSGSTNAEAGGCSGVGLLIPKGRNTEAAGFSLTSLGRRRLGLVVLPAAWATWATLLGPGVSACGAVTKN